MTVNDQNTLFKPFLTAGIIIIVFGVVCIWIAGTIGLQEEGEGFRIIGWSDIDLYWIYIKEFPLYLWPFELFLETVCTKNKAW